MFQKGLDSSRDVRTPPHSRRWKGAQHVILTQPCSRGSNPPIGFHAQLSSSSSRLHSVPAAEVCPCSAGASAAASVANIPYGMFAAARKLGRTTCRLHCRLQSLLLHAGQRTACQR